MLDYGSLFSDRHGFLLLFVSGTIGGKISFISLLKLYLV